MTDSFDRSDTGSSRARIGRPSGRLDRSQSAQLAASLGVVLRELRIERGLSTRKLAAYSGVARSTVTRLEAGQRRPRRSLLANLAYGLSPDNPTPIIATLVCAAGDFLASESPWSERMHHRRLEQAILSGRAKLPDRIAKPLALHQAADNSWREAMALLDEPGALNNAAILDRVDHLLTVCRRAREQAGSALTVRIGSHEIKAGFG